MSSSDIRLLLVEQVPRAAVLQVRVVVVLARRLIAGDVAGEEAAAGLGAAGTVAGGGLEDEQVRVGRR